eukprot:15439651-Alexandrium_andersonii.AAC.1
MAGDESLRVGRREAAERRHGVPPLVRAPTAEAQELDGGLRAPRSVIVEPKIAEVVLEEPAQIGRLDDSWCCLARRRGGIRQAPAGTSSRDIAPQL